MPFYTDIDALNEFFERTAGTVSLSASRQQFGTAWPFYVILIPDETDKIPPLYSVLAGEIQRTKVQVSQFGYDIPISVQEVN